MIRPQVFKKTPETVEAWLWDGSNEVAELICDWVESNGGFAAVHPYVNQIILGDETAPVKANDWVIRDKFNDFWPLGDDVFYDVYESLL